MGPGVPPTVLDLDVESGSGLFYGAGEQLAFTAVEDVYFLTGLPFRGMPLPAKPVLPGDG
jgi:hypothetical protein